MLTLLYFYPKDDTPGCTLEAQDFSRLRGDFLDLAITIQGVSLDSSESHDHFREKYDLSIDLISDQEKALHTQYGVIGEKMNYGKKYIGVIRSTFLLGADGTVLREWRNVRAKGHAEKILREVRAFLDS